MTNDELIIECEEHAREQAQKDLFFSGLKPLAKLTEDEKRIVCDALMIYARSGANRAIRHAIKLGKVI